MFKICDEQKYTTNNISAHLKRQTNKSYISHVVFAQSVTAIFWLLFFISDQEIWQELASLDSGEWDAK